MSSLATTTEKMRSILKIGGIIVGALFTLYIIVMIGIFFKNIFFPTPLEPPKQAFGKLPEIIFEPQASSGTTYHINTVSGSLPANLPSRMLVYKLAQPAPDLLSLQNARIISSNAGFSSDEQKISDNIYRWTNPANNAVILLDIANKNFEISSNILSSQNILTNASLPPLDRIEQSVRNFLSSMQVDLTNLGYKENANKFYTFSGNNLTEVGNILNAKVARVNLFNNNIENDFGNFSFVYPDPESPLVSLLVAFPSSSKMTVLEGKSYNKVLTDESSDYPIKSVEEAFSDLQSGRGYLYNPTNLNSIQITDVYLSYYLDKNITDFAQPVFVFEGVGSKAYIPAVQISTQSAEMTSE